MRRYAALKLSYITDPDKCWAVIYKDENEEVWYDFLSMIDMNKAKTVADAMNISS